MTTTRLGTVAVLKVDEPRLTYPMLADFAAAVTDLIGRGEKHLLLDLGAVSYLDSAAIGCLMDLYRQASSAGGALKLSGVQKRVETMLTMTGAHNFLEVHGDLAAAVASFGG
ncbi:MAG: STAS domain-containing protein [Acidobacteria bacterium]|nr:STAS domain-containing protein [Acidobacteriota bacterium]